MAGVVVPKCRPIRTDHEFLAEGGGGGGGGGGGEREISNQNVLCGDLKRHKGHMK